MISEQDRQYVKTLWDYNYINADSGDADLLLVMGSNDLRVAHHAAALAKQQSYRFIVCSGGVAHQGDLLETDWQRPEADMFAEIMEKEGVSGILRETSAQHSGDNIVLTRAILGEKSTSIKTGLLVQKPFMLRRALATAQQQWPEVQWNVSAENISYEDYVSHFDEEKLINIIVGDTQRHALYAQKGFQVEQDIPETVLEATEVLVKNGFDRHLPNQ